MNDMFTTYREWAIILIKRYFDKETLTPLLLHELYNITYNDKCLLRHIEIIKKRLTLAEEEIKENERKKPH